MRVDVVEWHREDGEQARQLGQAEHDVHVGVDAVAQDQVRVLVPIIVWVGRLGTEVTRACGLGVAAKLDLSFFLEARKRGEHMAPASGLSERMGRRQVLLTDVDLLLRQVLTFYLIMLHVEGPALEWRVSIN